eukprot:s1099_g20.t1
MPPRKFKTDHRRGGGASGKHVSSFDEVKARNAGEESAYDKAGDQNPGTPTSIKLAGKQCMACLLLSGLVLDLSSPIRVFAVARDEGQASRQGVLRLEGVLVQSSCWAERSPGPCLTSRMATQSGHRRIGTSDVGPRQLFTLCGGDVQLYDWCLVAGFDNVVDSKGGGQSSFP